MPTSAGPSSISARPGGQPQALPPRNLGSYEIERELGRGGMGVVYLARDPRLDRPVALKVLPPEHSSDPQRLRRFETEARAVASLNHPHILGVFDIGSGDGTTWVAFELLEGRTRGGDVLLHGRELDVRQRTVNVELLVGLADFDGGAGEGYCAEAQSGDEAFHGVSFQ